MYTVYKYSITYSGTLAEYKTGFKPKKFFIKSNYPKTYK